VSLNTIKQLRRDFTKARDWDQFHSPKNLSMALSVEVAEILEHFQWLTEKQSKNLSQEKIEAELADKLDIDLLVAAKNEIELNEHKYPVHKAKGNAKKYTELDK